MESLRIEILNPKAKRLMESLAYLNLIKIQKETGDADFAGLLDRLRKNQDDSYSIEEITREVESVREQRHEK